MTIDTWVLIASGFVIMISFGLCVIVLEHCSTLEQDVEQLLHYSNKQAKTIASLEKRVRSLEEDIKIVKNEHQVYATSISKMLAETDRKADNINSSVEKQIKELYDIVQRENKEELYNIVSPKDNDTNSDEVPVYRWVFPSEEPDHGKQLICGQWYTVIGVLKNSETTEMVSREGFWSWNEQEFVTADGDRFDTVYAYIRRPESADVMEKVVQMALANKG